LIAVTIDTPTDDFECFLACMGLLTLQKPPHAVAIPSIATPRPTLARAPLLAPFSHVRYAGAAGTGLLKHGFEDWMAGARALGYRQAIDYIDSDWRTTDTRSVQGA
jgi:hypothetical protein